MLLLVMNSFMQWSIMKGNDMSSEMEVKAMILYLQAVYIMIFSKYLSGTKT